MSFQQLLSATEDTFSNVATTLATSDKPSGLDDAELEMFGEVDDLSSAIKSDKAFVDNQKPSDLANFDTQWKNGRVRWNEAVTKIWNVAGQPPPTVDAS